MSWTFIIIIGILFLMMYFCLGMVLWLIRRQQKRMNTTIGGLNKRIDDLTASHRNWVRLFNEFAGEYKRAKKNQEIAGRQQKKEIRRRFFRD